MDDLIDTTKQAEKFSSPVKSIKSIGALSKGKSNEKKSIVDRHASILQGDLVELVEVEEEDIDNFLDAREKEVRASFSLSMID